MCAQWRGLHAPVMAPPYSEGGAVVCVCPAGGLNVCHPISMDGVD
jgi:hypothetical protein